MEEQGKQQEIEIEEVTAQENVIAVRDLVPMRAAMDDSMERIAEFFAVRDIQPTVFTDDRSDPAHVQCGDVCNDGKA